MAADTVWFIDANQYLKLYGFSEGRGKQLMNWLDEQYQHIFISTRIVDEVLRRKLECAHTFFSDKLKEVKEIEGPIPDHLLGVSEEKKKITEFRKTFDQAVKLKNEFVKMTADTLSRISRSEDDVSQRVKRLFDKAERPSHDQMQRARDRKEKGNPPGKQKIPSEIKSPGSNY
jgi:PIN like domain